MLGVRSACLYLREPGRVQEADCSRVFAQRGCGQRLQPRQVSMLDRLSEKLTAEAAALPVVSDGDRNFARTH